MEKDSINDKGMLVVFFVRSYIPKQFGGLFLTSAALLDLFTPSLMGQTGLGCYGYYLWKVTKKQFFLDARKIVRDLRTKVASFSFFLRSRITMPVHATIDKFNRYC